MRPRTLGMSLIGEGPASFNTFVLIIFSHIQYLHLRYKTVVPTEMSPLKLDPTLPCPGKGLKPCSEWAFSY